MKNVLILLFFSVSIILQSTNVSAQDYNSAIGLRPAWGIAATGKVFLNESSAVEGIVNYRNFNAFDYSYNWLRIQALYEIHNDIEVDGLRWYYGGGAYVGFFSGDYAFEFDSDSATFVGVSGVIGLDYTFENIPLNLSLDWMPLFNFSGGYSGFDGQGGGIAIRYVLSR